MTYREARGLKPDGRVQVRATGRNLNVTRIDHDARARKIVVTCDDGRSYGHVELDRACLVCFLDHRVSDGEKASAMRRFATGDRPPADNGTWFVFDNGDMQYIYRPGPEQVRAMDTCGRKLARTFRA